MFRKYKYLLIHTSSSFLIPLFISTTIFMNQHYFTIYKDVKFYEILWYLTCCIPILLSSVILFLFINIVPHIIIISSVIIRLLCILFFIFLYNGNKRLGIISDVIFVIANIFIGLFVLVMKWLRFVA